MKSCNSPLHPRVVAPDPTPGLLMHPRSLLLGLCLALVPRLAAAQIPASLTVDTVSLQRFLVAEDARGTGADGIAPLLSALRGPDTLLRRLAVRGLGRFQRPELGQLLLPS